MSFEEQTCLVFMKFDWSFYTFMDCAFGSYVRHLCQNQGHEGFSLNFFSIGFIVLGFTFKSIIHFKLTLVYEVKYGPMCLFFFLFNVKIHLF